MKLSVQPLLVLRRLKPYHRRIAFFFLFLFSAILFDSCSYYYKRTLEDDKITLKELNKNIAKNKKFVLMTPQATWVASTISIRDQHTLDLSLTRVELSRINRELEYLKTAKTRKVAPGHELLQQMVILHSDYDQEINEREIALPLASIQKVEVFDTDVGSTIFAVLGVTVIILGIIAIIIVLTKSSCPFLYIYDGEEFALAAETFGGAIYPGLERSDYIPLPNAKPLNGNYQFKLRNELQEIQYINKIRLQEAIVPKNTRLGIDQNGTIHTIQSLITPYAARTDDFRDVRESLIDYDSLLYNFDNQADISHVTLSFEKPAEATTAKLVLRAKGTLWFDYVFGEFLKLFGTQYPAFAAEQSTKTPDEMGWWSKEQHIPLEVSIKQDGLWQVIEEIQPIGPLTQAREIIVPINLNDNHDEHLDIRLSTGFYFWEVDYAAVDYSADQPLEVRSSTINTAYFNEQVVDNGALDNADGTYVIQEHYGDVLDFTITPQFPEGTHTMIFLEVGGYYTHVREFKNGPDILTLETFRRPGRLSEFSRQLFNYQTAPLLASGQEP